MLSVICPGGRPEVVVGACAREYQGLRARWWRVLALGSGRGFALESGGRPEVVVAGPCARWRVLAVGINQRDAEEFSG